MKRTLVKYPPTEPEHCTYDVVSEARWNTITNTLVREKMRPFAGPYFDGEGWMLNAVLADLKNASIALVAGMARDEHGNEREGITVYRAQGEMLGDWADER
jgi:hypothetical protein